MGQTFKVKDLELDNKGDIIKKKKHTIKHSKENALEPGEEQKEIFNVIRNLKYNQELRYKYEVLVHLMMNAGLRVSEALQVRYDWFKDTEEGIIITIPNKARDMTNLKRDWKPKTKAGHREVIFVDNAVGEKVRSYFISNKSLGILRQRAYQVVRLIGSKMNKPQLHPHALRSTYANTLVYAGVNASTLCYYMGWNDLNTAVNYIRTSNISARKDILSKMRRQ